MGEGGDIVPEEFEFAEVVVEAHEKGAAPGVVGQHQLPLDPAAAEGRVQSPRVQIGWGCRIAGDGDTGERVPFLV